MEQEQCTQWVNTEPCCVPLSALVLSHAAFATICFLIICRNFYFDIIIHDLLLLLLPPKYFMCSFCHLSNSLFKKITFNYLYAHVSIHTNVLEMPEEGVRSYGAELKVILSFLMQMLETIMLSHLSSTLLIFKPSIKYGGVFSTLIL